MCMGIGLPSGDIFYKFRSFICPLIPSHWDNCRALQPYVSLLTFWQTPQFYPCDHFGRYLVIDSIQIPAPEILKPLCWAWMHRCTSDTVNDLAHWPLPTLLSNYHYIHLFALRSQLSVCWLPLTRYYFYLPTEKITVVRKHLYINQCTYSPISLKCLNPLSWLFLQIDDIILPNYLHMSCVLLGPISLWCFMMLP